MRQRALHQRSIFSDSENLAVSTEEAPANPKVSKLEILLQDMRTNKQPETIVDAAPPKSVVEDIPESPSRNTPAPLTGYIVFLGAILFFIRPPKPGN